MPPLAKESVDIGASTQHALAQQSEPQPKPPSGQATSAAASLEVPVHVFGSHAAAADNPLRAEPFSEKTNTIIVLPGGGVLRMAAAVNVGQMLVMTNLKTRTDVICRVTKVRSSSNAQAYVEVEFIQPNPTYWGVNFASKPGASRPEASPATPPIEQRVALKALGASAGVSVMPSRPTPFIVSPNVRTEESVSISDGDSSAEVPTESVHLSPRDSAAIEPWQAPTGNQSEHEDSAAGAFTDIADKIRLAFARLCNTQGERVASHNPRKKRMLVFGSAATLFVLVAGGVWYFHPKAQLPAGETNVASLPVEERAPSAVVPPPADPVSVSHDSMNRNDPVLRRPAPRRELISASHALKMHPRPSQHTANPPQTSAPAISAEGSAQPTELPGIASSSISVTPPHPAGPIAVGGAVKEPKLIAARLPVYPVAAKQARVQGDVLVDTQIDTDGRVMQTRIVSGPVMLRQAALDALRTWKYEPSQLDGQPIQVETLVLIKFRL